MSHKKHAVAIFFNMYIYLRACSCMNPPVAISKQVNDLSGGYLLLMMEAVYLPNSNLWDKESVRRLIIDAGRYVNAVQQPPFGDVTRFLQYVDMRNRFRDTLAIVRRKLAGDPVIVAQYGSFPDKVIDADAQSRICRVSRRADMTGLTQIW